METIIKATELHKVFINGDSKTAAVKNVSISFRAGESVAITGPSGCGKTTLLNLLGLIVQPTGGTLLLESIDSVSLSGKQRAGYRNKFFGYIVQDFALVEEYTVFENVEIPLIYAKEKIKKSERKCRVLAALQQVGLRTKVNEQVRNLSGGQRQRVAIARAIVNNPKIILADEPTGSLDSTNTADIFELLMQLVRNGKTLIIATHNIELAERCDREVRLLDGEIVHNKLDLLTPTEQM